MKRLIVKYLGWVLVFYSLFVLTVALADPSNKGGGG